MSTYFYTGLTAFIRNTPETNDGFRALGEAMFQLQPYIGIHDEEDFSGFDGIMNSESFKFIEDNDGMLSPSDYMFPENTPEKYQTVELESIEVNDVHMTRLYIPAISKNDDRVNTMIMDSIRPVLMALFGENLVAIKTKSSDEYSDFNDAKEVVVLSANRTQAPA